MVLNLGFKGFMAPVFTPFARKTGKLDLSVIKPYAQNLIKNGVRGVLVCGTVGEGVCMSVGERKAVLEAWMEATQETSVHVMVQIGGLSLVDVQSLARHAESQGVSSLLCLPDLFHRPKNVAELAQYLRLVGSAAPATPLLYYHYPACTAVTLDMADFLKAAAAVVPSLAGVKFTHNNLEEGSRALRVNDKQFNVLLGNDQLIAAGFVQGFDSLIATTLNMFAPLIAEIQSGVTNSKVSHAQSKQEELIRIIDTITKYGNWVPTMKAAMHVVTGLDFGEAREPQGCLTEAQVRQLHSDLAALHLAH